VKKSFTLIELIVVIAIIAILAAIIAPNAFKAIEKAKISQVIGTFKVVKSALGVYYTDTGQWPPTYGRSQLLNPALNPFINDQGDAGWDGPYLDNYATTHPWGGSIEWWSEHANMSGGAELDSYLNLDDDSPDQPETANNGKMPTSACEKIDAIFDNGNLSSGKACGDAKCAHSSEGSLMLLMVVDGEII